MKDRTIEIMEFLAAAGWDNATQIPLRADFSSRRFARLQRSSGSLQQAVLMDADPDQKTDKFVTLASVLRDLNVSVPEIYAADAKQGLVLMEDFGDRNLGHMLDRGEEASPLYHRAVDVLIHIHQQFDKEKFGKIAVPLFDAALFTAQTQLFLDAWFLLEKKRAASDDEAASFRLAWQVVLGPIDRLPQTLMLRDFMLDNLMELKDRADWRAIGVLDFQDGGIGPIAYDLASLCEVVRRDSASTVFDHMIDYYYERAALKTSKSELRTACRILAAQRHTRILGIIANRVLKTGQSDKLEYAPRVWDCLNTLLQDAALLPVREWMDRHVSAAERSRVA